jgi:hypothetical protein
VRAGVLTGDGGDGGVTVFREADGGGNGGISGGVADTARGHGRGELGGTEFCWPLGVAGGFVEEKWRERGSGSQLGDGEARRGKKRGGPTRAAPRGGRGAWRPAGRATGGSGRQSTTCEQRRVARVGRA